MPRIAMCLAFLLSIAIDLPAQVTQTQALQSTTMPAATKDPQAVTIINQALAIAGGAQAVSAIRDYTGSGTITYHQDSETELQGPATLKGRGAAQFRMDANLPSGNRSWVVNQGQSSANGLPNLQSPPMAIPSSDAFPGHPLVFPGGLGFPDSELSLALNDPHFALAYKGLVQMNGRSMHDIQVQRVMPGIAVVKASASPYDVKDYFIESSTFQVVMTQDTVPKLVVRQTQYSNYTPVNGVLIPFSINQQIAGQQLWLVQLNQIIFNSGLQASVFVQ